MPEAAPEPTRVVCFVGPTGTGKNDAALHLAACTPASVVNFDSRQVFRHFPIVTAQPGPKDLETCPHHLYGFLDCHEKIDAGRFLELARKTVDQVAAQKRLPLLVGGTGLYLRAFASGLAPIPPIPDQISRSVRDQVSRQGAPAMHKLLAELDPHYAAAIHPNDSQRIARALEVREATGRPLSWWHGRPHEHAGCRCLKIGLSMPLDKLAPRLEKRIQAMLEAGAVQEVAQAWERCPDPDLPAFTGIGCAELLDHVRGRTTLDQATALMLKNTRAYAKRQMTWFKKDKEIVWITPGDWEASTRAALEWAKNASGGQGG